MSNDSVVQNDNKDFSIDEDAFIDGLWDDGKKREFSTNEENVETRQLESVENIDESGIIKQILDNGSRVIGEYTDKKTWGIHEIDVQPDENGFWGTRKNKVMKELIIMS